jgi:DNA helicase-2/ATP-dependent DNA helicase PcrA
MPHSPFPGLNPEQLQAVESTEGFFRVIAGAGSGKTRALTARYAHLTENLGISTSRILCLTFTNKSAKEMRKRINKLTGGNAGYVCTFHGFAVQFLREDCNAVQYPKDFIILDEEDMRGIISKCFEKFHMFSSWYAPAKPLFLSIVNLPSINLFFLFAGCL